jgi:hypothetical protein
VTSTVALASAAQGVRDASAGPRTTVPTTVVDIRVTITDKAVAVTPNVAPRGTYARFTLVNLGKKPHRFTLGSTNPAPGAQKGFTSLLRPKKRKMLTLFLDYRGRVAYRATLPADRKKMRMRGIFTIL